MNNENNGEKQQLRDFVFLLLRLFIYLFNDKTRVYFSSLQAPSNLSLETKTVSSALDV